MSPYFILFIFITIVLGGFAATLMMMLKEDHETAKHAPHIPEKVYWRHPDGEWIEYVRKTDDL